MLIVLGMLIVWFPNALHVITHGVSVTYAVRQKVAR